MKDQMTSAEFQARYGNAGRNSDPPKRPAIRMPAPTSENKNEAAYRRVLEIEFRDCDVRYEAIKLRLPSGTTYTPDFSIFQPSGRLLLVEVKGSYRLGSASKSAHAFKEAVSAFPEISFRHATASKDGWIITNANN